MALTVILVVSRVHVSMLIVVFISGWLSSLVHAEWQMLDTQIAFQRETYSQLDLIDFLKIVRNVLKCHNTHELRITIKCQCILFLPRLTPRSSQPSTVSRFGELIKCQLEFSETKHRAKLSGATSYLCEMLWLIYLLFI